MGYKMRLAWAKTVGWKDATVNEAGSIFYFLEFSLHLNFHVFLVVSIELDLIVAMRFNGMKYFVFCSQMSASIEKLCVNEINADMFI